jgi:hypothetical protein
MNSLYQREADVLHETQQLRHHVLDVLTDEQLSFALPDNPTLGVVLREHAEVEHTYVESFRTFRQTFDYRHPDAELDRSRAKLQAWYSRIDHELDAVLMALSEDDVQNKTVERYGWYPKLGIQIHVYREAILITMAKVSVYLRALGVKPEQMPERWRYWMGYL